MVRRAFWLSVVLAAGCGLLPTSDTLAPFPSDGVGNFGDSEPIEVCLGSARVVAPGAATGADAVCVPSGAVAKSCSSNDACAGIERCVCGRCTIEACQGGNTCGEGRVCRDKRCTVACTADADCDKGEVCNAGGCARPCGGDGDCHFGERCDALGNTCVAKICSEAQPCGGGQRCEPVSFAAELHEPEVTDAGGTTTAFVEIRTSGANASSAIYRARIDAPTRWTIEPTDPVIAAGMGQSAGGPSALVDGDRVELYFALGDGAAVARAVSTDGGKTFARDAAPVLTAGAGWENGWIGSPAVVQFQGATYLFYEGGPRAGIGVARVDGGAATRLSDAPVVTPETAGDSLFWRDVTEVREPYAVVAGSALRVYFTGRGVEGSDAIVADAAVPADPNDSIGLAATFDLKTWKPYPDGPVLARLTNLRTYLGEREAAVRLLSGGGAEITFVAADASGKNESGLARAGR
jgi:hypothetical protein